MKAAEEFGVWIVRYEDGEYYVGEDGLYPTWSPKQKDAMRFSSRSEAETVVSWWEKGLARVVKLVKTCKH